MVRWTAEIGQTLGCSCVTARPSTIHPSCVLVPEISNSSASAKLSFQSKRVPWWGLSRRLLVRVGRVIPISTGVEVDCLGWNKQKILHLEALLTLTLGKTKSSKQRLIRDGYVLFQYIAPCQVLLMMSYILVVVSRPLWWKLIAGSYGWALLPLP